MQITPFGAAKTVTGSCYSITAEGNKILVDCGMFQGSKKEEKLNYDEFGFEPKRYIALFLTNKQYDKENNKIFDSQNFYRIIKSILFNY